MNGLWLVNWASVNRVFCALCWLAVVALVLYIIGEISPTVQVHHPVIVGR